MFFEKCGKLFFLKMRPVFFFVLLFLPFVLALFFLFSTEKNLEALRWRFISALKKEKIADEKRKQKELFLSRYTDPDPYFLSKTIEPFALLQKEKEKLLSIQNSPAQRKSLKLRARLKKLEENKLFFMEENIKIQKEFKETEEKMRNSVEVDEEDLQKLLFLIEDISQDTKEKRPQIFVQDFSLKKIETEFETEVFELKMDLIKREFLSL